MIKLFLDSNSGTGSTPHVSFAYDFIPYDVSIFILDY